MKSIFVIVMFLLVSIALSVNIVSNAGADSNGKLVGVIDGDTLLVELDGRTEKVRLIGIDTPESTFNQKALLDSKRTHTDLKVITQLGKKAASYLESQLTKGATLRLEFDVEHRDKYSRVLAYVYRTDGQMLNELLLSNGYARLMTKPPNVRHNRRFQSALQDAKKNNRGLWKYSVGTR
jgi:micrococcal nuclease